MELSSHQMNEIFFKLAVLPTSFIVSLLYVSYFQITVRIFSWDNSSSVSIMCNFTKTFNFNPFKDIAGKKPVFYM